MRAITRLDLRLWTRTQVRGLLWVAVEPIVGFYGLGNASPLQQPWKDVDRLEEPDAWRVARRFEEFQQRKVDLRLGVRRELDLPGLEFFGYGGALFSDVLPWDGSRLDEELSGGSGEFAARVLAVGVGLHGGTRGQVGLRLDTRDDEADPRSGMNHEVSVRGGVIAPGPHGWVGVNGSLAGYLPLVPELVTLAGRFVVDLQFGEPPFYLLAELGQERADVAFGGSRGVRGLQPWRLYGKHKVIASAELRLRFIEFRLFKRETMLGAALFVDVGRVWTDVGRHPELDGAGLGLHPGIGGGLRIRFGETFLARFDVGVAEGGSQFVATVGQAF